MAGIKVVLTPEEIVDKLKQELTMILKFRDENHYRRGRPDEDDLDYDTNLGGHDSAWEEWANAMYSHNNRMGHHIAVAQKLADALHRWILDQER